MSIVGIVLTILYVIGFIYCAGTNRLDKYRYVIFCAMVVLTIFVNVGYSIFRIPYAYFAEYCYLAVVIATVVKKQKIIVSKQDTASWVVVGFLIFSILIGFACLLVSNDMPYIIPMTVQMDDVYYGFTGVSIASFSTNNIKETFYFLIFILVLMTSRKYFDSQEKINAFLRIILKAFYVFFALWTIEWILNNLVSVNLWRDAVYSLFGMSDKNKTYYAQQRFGLYGFSGFYTEQSYISLMLIYYGIIYKRGLSGIKTKLGYIWSILILLMNGSTSGLLLIAMAGFVAIKNYITFRKINLANIMSKIVLMFGVIIIGFMIWNSYHSEINTLIEFTQTKITAYLSGGYYNTSDEVSAAIRNASNKIAFAAFYRYPLFGVGLGTTRGYGIIPGILVSIGLVGTLAYVIMIVKIYDFKFSLQNVILAIVIVAYFSTFLNIWYIYYPALIPLYILFSDKLQRIQSIDTTIRDTSPKRMSIYLR